MFINQRVIRTKWKKPIGPGKVLRDTIGYVEDGVASYLIGEDNEEQKVSQGNFIWLPCETMRHMTPVTDTVTIYSLQFVRTKTCGEQSFHEMGSLPDTPATSMAINPAYVENLLKSAERMWLQQPEFADLEIGGVVVQIIAQFLRSLLHDDLSPYVRLQVDRVVEYIGLNFKNPDICLRDLAAVAGWSERYLISIFKNVTKETPMAYITRLRLNLSFDLLASGNFSIAEVSQMVGWRDPAYFSRVFSRHFGQPPSTFVGVERSLDMA